jgi:alkanesulfonate monooxygenase SsuD/methylene tetrahydromethanopterin reductase-like flavin-dependent oxidoreductase (luciferase family)
MTGQHDASRLVELAVRAERAGFDSVWTGDSPLARTRLDPVALLAAVSAVTSRVTVGTAALLAPLRQPVLAAHALASVDQLSAGRLVVGVGAGFPSEETRREFDAVAMPFPERVRVLDAAVRAWRDGWAVPRSTDAFVPLPAVRPSGPPVWLAGGDTPRVIERAAAGYDGWLPFLPDSDAYARAWTRIRARADELGRSVLPAMFATVALGSDPGRAGSELDDYVRAYYRRPLAEMAAFQAYRAGSAAEILDWLRGYVEAGARHLVLRLGSFDPAGQLDQLADQVLPVLRALAVR